MLRSRVTPLTLEPPLHQGAQRVVREVKSSARIPDPTRPHLIKRAPIPRVPPHKVGSPGKANLLLEELTGELNPLASIWANQAGGSPDVTGLLVPPPMRARVRDAETNQRPAVNLSRIGTLESEVLNTPSDRILA